MSITIQRLSASNRADFAKVHCERNGEGWCNCVAWWIPTWEGWSERTAEANLNLRNELFDRGEYDGYVLYLDSVPVGWCQCGPRDRLGKLVAQYELTPSPETWAVTCFVLAPSARGKGLGRALLQAVVKDLAARGVTHVQGFPKAGEALPSGDAWTGTEAMFRTAGFVVERKSARFPIYGWRTENGTK